MFLVVPKLLVKSLIGYKLSRGKAAYDSPNPSDSGRAPASVNAVSRERLALMSP